MPSGPEPLGRGFHQNVYPSPVRHYGDWGLDLKARHRSGSLSCSEMLPDDIRVAYGLAPPVLDGSTEGRAEAAS